MVKANVVIKNASGLHLRPTGVLCNEAIRYQSSVKFQSGNTLTNAKSVLSVLGACVKSGDQVEFICEGPVRRPGGAGGHGRGGSPGGHDPDY